LEFLEDEFIYESDDSGDEWHDDNISSELENAFSKIVSSSSKPDIWKTEGRPQFYTGAAPKTIRLKQDALKNAAKGTEKITSFFPVIIKIHILRKNNLFIYVFYFFLQI
jgi:hypothetical protein